MRRKNVFFITLTLGMRSTGSPADQADEERPPIPGSPAASDEPRALDCTTALKQREIEAQLQFLKAKQVRTNWNFFV